MGNSRNWRQRLAFVADWLRGTRAKPLLALTLLCLVVKEQYPFSNFPMYSSFGPSTYYLYLADGNGAPVASLPTLGISTPTLKKIFSSEMGNERERLGTQRLTPEEKRAVGEQLLARLKDSPAARQRGGSMPPVLRLYQVDISQVGGRFEKDTTLIAEVR